MLSVKQNLLTLNPLFVQSRSAECVSLNSFSLPKSACCLQYRLYECSKDVGYKRVKEEVVTCGGLRFKFKYEKLKKGICFNMDTRAGLVRIFQVKTQTVLQKETSLQKQKIDEFLVSFLK